MNQTTTQSLTVDLLWKLARIGAPSLSPDGSQVVCAVTQPSMEDNRSRSALWLFSTTGLPPRQLTTCGDKDSQPQFSPCGDWIAFVATREQDGKKDPSPQLYLMPTAGGEARRAGEVPTGVCGFKWFPDSRHIALISWVWPSGRGVKDQAARIKAFSERKETSYATEDAVYRHWDDNLPMGRVPHLLSLEISTGRVTDLLESTNYELSRREPGADDLAISPDGRRLVFVHDPRRGQHPAPRMALAQIEFQGRTRSKFKITDLIQDGDWDLSGPSFSPDGRSLAFLASHQVIKHTMPKRLAVLNFSDHGTHWQTISEEWDREAHAPLLWSDDSSSLLFRAEDHGRQPVWRFELSERHARQVAAGGTIQAFDAGFGQLVTVLDCATHPGRLFAIGLDATGMPETGPANRIESLNDELLRSIDLGSTEEHWIAGAQGDQIQVWLYFPPGFDRKKKYPLLHIIHGGPHTGPGDNWHWRWNYHLFAAQGYVTANVNYHGSSGFGHAFLDSITHQWGALEFQDIEATTDWLLKKPWIARKRVFATGGSYGGYMVAWMNAHVEPGRYQAYVCHAGCYDWVGMFADDAYGWHAQELGAWFWDDMAKVHGQSPHTFAATMRTPTLVIHGAKDYRVPDAQGLAYYNTLKARGVDARLLWFPDENHWVLKPRNCVVWYREFFEWLKRYDKHNLTGG